jgi:hypothetical protein
MENNKTVTVDGFIYMISHPQVEVGWEIGVELIKMIGGPAAAMSMAGGDQESAARALSGAVTALLSKVSPRDSFILMKKLLATVECQGPEDGAPKKFMLDDVGIKTHFRGKLGSMLKLTGEAIAFTHDDFFDAIVDGVATLMKKASAKMEGQAE